MKRIGLFFSLILTMWVIGCTSSNKEDKSQQQKEPTEQVCITDSVWLLVDYVNADGIVTQIPQDEPHFLILNTKDEAFGINTDCSIIVGMYKVKGERLKFYDLLSTEESCEENKLEEAISTLLPRVNMYSIESDSILQLRSDKSILLTLVKSTQEAFDEIMEQ